MSTEVGMTSIDTTEQSRDSTYYNEYESPRLAASNSMSTHSVSSPSSIRSGVGSGSHGGEIYEPIYITKKGSKKQYLLKQQISTSVGANNTNKQNQVSTRSQVVLKRHQVQIIRIV